MLLMLQEYKKLHDELTSYKMQKGAGDSTGDSEKPSSDVSISSLEGPPRRSSEMIGWKIGQSKVEGEVYGRYEKSRPKTTVHKIFSWPIEAERWNTKD